MDQNCADEIAELANPFFAEHGIGLAVQLRSVAGDHLCVAGVVRVLGDECGEESSAKLRQKTSIRKDTYKKLTSNDVNFFI